MDAVAHIAFMARVLQLEDQEPTLSLLQMSRIIEELRRLGQLPELSFVIPTTAPAALPLTVSLPNQMQVPWAPVEEIFQSEPCKKLVSLFNKPVGAEDAENVGAQAPPDCARAQEPATAGRGRGGAAASASASASK